jgi:predicted transcriptional regulator of viral defense system
MADCDGRYQICGPNAFFRYGFDNQIPTRVYAYNNRLSGDRTIGAVALTLIKVADNRLGCTQEFETSEGNLAVYSSRVRTLVDAVYDWSRFDSLPSAYDWIRRDLQAGRINASELVKATIRFSNQGTLRRIGALLDRQGAPARLLAKVEHALRPSSSVIPWNPVLPKKGKVDSRWGIVVNG